MRLIMYISVGIVLEVWAVHMWVDHYNNFQEYTYKSIRHHFCFVLWILKKGREPHHYLINRYWWPILIVKSVFMCSHMCRHVLLILAVWPVKTTQVWRHFVLMRRSSLLLLNIKGENIAISAGGNAHMVT